jgi:hypothetical protein
MCGRSACLRQVEHPRCRRPFRALTFLTCGSSSG